MRRLIFCLLFATAVFAQTQLSPEVKAFVTVEAPIVALTHIRVIDGTGAPPKDDQTIVVANGHIQSVSDSASSAVPAGAKVLDLHGYTAIPGLVGMHDHLFYPAGGGWFTEMDFSSRRLYLAGGVTTIRTGLATIRRSRSTRSAGWWDCAKVSVETQHAASLRGGEVHARTIAALVAHENRFKALLRLRQPFAVREFGDHQHARILSRHAHHDRAAN